MRTLLFLLLSGCVYLLYLVGQSNAQALEAYPETKTEELISLKSKLSHSQYKGEYSKASNLIDSCLNILKRYDEYGVRDQILIRQYMLNICCDSEGMLEYHERREKIQIGLEKNFWKMYNTIETHRQQRNKQKIGKTKVVLLNATFFFRKKLHNQKSFTFFDENIKGRGFYKPQFIHVHNQSPSTHHRSYSGYTSFLSD